YKAAIGADKPTSDPMEAAYTSVFLWKNTDEKAKSFQVAEIQAAAGRQPVRAGGGGALRAPGAGLPPPPPRAVRGGGPPGVVGHAAFAVRRRVCDAGTTWRSGGQVGSGSADRAA
ncbi:transporter substrate-binding protein, partial [Nocardia brasiliensis]|uniref:transporter substrate-binding protein n=1 Tax=Nocardia brasiliensis TaxID=37326 RepID=UPI00245538AC